VKEEISYYGIDCSECPVYIATQKNDLEEIERIAKEWSHDSLSFTPENIFCDRCTSKGRHFSWCNECPIRAYCMDKGIKNCAYCEDYFCDKLNMTFENTPSAKERLDEFREKFII